MLNELSQVVTAMDRFGLVVPSRHKDIQPMGKNSALFVVCVDSLGIPRRTEFVPADRATQLLKYCPGNNGPSFPGLNLPTPFRKLSKEAEEKLRPTIEAISRKGKRLSSAESASYAAGLHDLFAKSDPVTFSKSDRDKFERSCGVIAARLEGLISHSQAELTNLFALLKIMTGNKVALDDFVERFAALLLAEHLSSPAALKAVQAALFGTLGKTKKDEKRNQPIYLDLWEPDPAFKRVAHQVVSNLLADSLFSSGTGSGANGIDAFSGECVQLQSKFHEPKVTSLGNVKLFSCNTKEIHALRRYSLEESNTFPVSARLAQRMSDALLYLGNEERAGVSCCAIPGTLSGKPDLLFAFLEENPGWNEPLAKFLGMDTMLAAETSFAAATRPVISLLMARSKGNPNLHVRLFTLCSLDKARRQVGLARRILVHDLILAAEEWIAGANNCPAVNVSIYDKEVNKVIQCNEFQPSPIDLTYAANRIWERKDSGFTFIPVQTFTASEAFDVFLSHGPAAELATTRALGLLVHGSTLVCQHLVRIKIVHKSEKMKDDVKRHVLRVAALLGILLRKLHQLKETYMKEPVYQVGHLLALADALHFEYCKHVRNGDAPSQLIGNAQFNLALENPVAALARLAERIVPYQAWARTFHNTDTSKKSGWEKVVLRLLQENSEMFVETDNVAKKVNLGQLPTRMSDIDKAKLLLGYMADIRSDESQLTN